MLRKLSNENVCEQCYISFGPLLHINFFLEQYIFLIGFAGARRRDSNLNHMY